MEIINAVGRRKASVARVFMRKGSGDLKVNGKALEVYFPQKHVQNKVREPLNTVEMEGEIDFKINVNGGGFKGQAEAIRLGIARALVKLNEDFKKPLKDKDFLTRDSRVVERKKYGKPKARKSFQFSKR
ncbi:30S ribosomal protein S9 [Membranicola marinus]|uniref:Small ribosomal subunit protein uS9 n=1 Tax=Membranihabitans marinus TaxID=1227546 RepID=A0A953HRQ6_9BACT|nr:30S ribosomal protein S9 [Membranihabitans marinus]MBY5959708.1 30S ribosomal protein S9 [Membranihabitans marinus]